MYIFQQNADNTHRTEIIFIPEKNTEENRAKKGVERI